MKNSPWWCGKKNPDVMQFYEQYVLCVCVSASVDPASAPVASASETSSAASSEATTLL